MSWTSRITKMKKELMFHMLNLTLREFNKDGLSSMLIRLKLNLRMELEPEDSKSTNHSSSNQDFGWKESSLITATITATLLLENQERLTTDKFGYTTKSPRLSSLTMRSRIETTKRDLWTSDQPISLFKTLILDGTNSLVIAQVDISSLTNLSEPTKNGSDTSKPRPTLK